MILNNKIAGFVTFAKFPYLENLYICMYMAGGQNEAMPKSIVGKILIMNNLYHR